MILAAILLFTLCFYKTAAPILVPTQVNRAVPTQVYSAPRPVYNYSFVPGGVTGLADYKMRAAKDPLLTPLDWAHATETVVPKDMLVFVSYRKNGRAYWTKHPMLIHAGERILTDGVTTILARCGNAISWAPEQPVGSVPGELLDATVPDSPALPIIPVDGPPAVPAPPIIPPVSLTPPVILPPPTYPPVYYPPLYPPPTTPPTTVPEPGTAVLVLIGVACLGALGLWVKHKDKDDDAGGAGA
jgi:hypothetical protein